MHVIEDSCDRVQRLDESRPGAVAATHIVHVVRGPLIVFDGPTDANGTPSEALIRRFNRLDKAGRWHPTRREGTDDDDVDSSGNGAWRTLLPDGCRYVVSGLLAYQ